MASSEKVPPVALDPPPYTQQPSPQPQPVYPGQPQPSYQPQPGYPAQPDQQPQPGYPAHPGPQPQLSQPQPGCPAQPDQQPQPGYPAHPGPQPQLSQPQPGCPAQPGSPRQHAYPPPQRAQHVQQSPTVVKLGMPATQAIVLPVHPRPPTYIGLSICTCLFCACPVGLAAMMFSCMVDSAYDAGDYDGALRNSNNAKWLNLVSILCGIVFIIILAKESELL